MHADSQIFWFPGAPVLTAPTWQLVYTSVSVDMYHVYFWLKAETDLLWISDICRWAALICLFTAVIIVEQVLPNWEPPFMFTRWRFKQQRLAWLWLLERPFNNLGAFYLQHRIFSVLIKPDRTVLIELTRGLLLIPGITIEVGMAVLFIRSAGHCWLAFVVWRFANFSAWKCLGSHVVEMLMQQLVQKTCGFLNVCLKNGSRNGKRN